MTNFPSGALVLREFRLITDAHLAASQLSVAAANNHLDLRLVEVSPTAGGAWVCAWLPSHLKGEAEKIATRWQFEALDVDEALMSAFLSLSPKPPPQTSKVLVLEGENIVDVFRSAKAYSDSGATLIEIRVKRAGPTPGAYAYLATGDQAPAVSSPLKATAVDLVGDYRRFFL